MTRLRAKSDPFWATAINRMDPGVANIVRQLHATIQRSPKLAPLLWMGSGWRTGSSEHQSGRAIDIIITPNTSLTPTTAERAAGNLLAQWLIANGRALRIQWILFSTDGKPRPQSYNMDRGSWNSLSGRGSISGNHVDHLHVYFKTGARWPAALNGAVIGGTPTPSPGLPGTGAPGPTPTPPTGGLTMSDIKTIIDRIDALSKTVHQGSERGSANTQTLADLQLRRAQETVEAVGAMFRAQVDELRTIRDELIRAGGSEIDVDAIIAHTAEAARKGAVEAIESVPVTRVQVVDG